MKVSRRGFGSLLASIPVVGPMLDVGELTKSPGLLGGTNFCGSGSANNLGAMTQTGVDKLKNKRKMEYWQAYKMSLQIPALRDMFISNAYSEHRIVRGLDPDIAVLKAMSPMAKITFQRQRNVQYAVDGFTSRPVSWKWDHIQEYVNKLVWG